MSKFKKQDSDWLDEDTVRKIIDEPCLLDGEHTDNTSEIYTYQVSRGSLFTRILKTCDNPECLKTSWWRFFRNSDGKLLTGHKCPNCLTYYPPTESESRIVQQPLKGDDDE